MQLRRATLDELLNRSDAVCPRLEPTEETRGVIGGRDLGPMRQGVVPVRALNAPTARGDAA